MSLIRKILVCIYFVFFTLFISCSSTETSILDGIPVWADDGSEILCAINKCDDETFHPGHESNFRYDIFYYDTICHKKKALYIDRKVDGQESEVKDLYYMKSMGYIIIKSVYPLFTSGNIEKLSLNGENLLLVGWGLGFEGTNIDPADTGYILDVNIVPSVTGNILFKVVEFPKNTDTIPEDYHFYRANFLNSITLQKIGNDIYFYYYNSDINIRWEKDSIVYIFLAPESALSVGPYFSEAIPCNPKYFFPATSSSIYNPKNKQFLKWDWINDKLLFSDTIDYYDKWDLSKRSL